MICKNLPVFIFLALISNSGALRAADIVCADGYCSYDASLDIRLEKNTADFTQFEIRGLNSDVNIYTPNGSSPRSTKVWLEPVDPNGTNVSVTLPSQKKLNNGGSTVLIGTSIDGLSINLSGRNGDGTHDASQVCAQKIIAGDYGPTIKSRFLLERYNDPTLPADRCVSADLVSIQNNEFTCPTGQSPSTATLTAMRWVKRRQCESKSERRMCVGKTMKITCTWIAERFTPGTGSCSQDHVNGTATLNPKPKGGGVAGTDWVCDPTVASETASGWKLVYPNQFHVQESFVQSRRLAGKTDEMICDELTGRNTTYLEQFPDLVRNEVYDAPSGVFWNYGNVTIKEGEEWTVIKGKWYGKNSRSTIGNPWPVIYAPSSTYFMDGEFKPCFTSGMHGSNHLWSLLANGCTFTQTVNQEIKTDISNDTSCTGMICGAWSGFGL